MLYFPKSVYILSPVNARFVLVNAIADNVADANAYLAKDRDMSVITETAGLVIIANRGDLGVKAK